MEGLKGRILTAALVLGLVLCGMQATAVASSADINNDGVVNEEDVTLAINAALGLDIGDLDADIDGSGTVDSGDVQLVINEAILRCDINQDGLFDGEDVNLVICAALGIPISYDADVNGDGSINGVDTQLVINMALAVQRLNADVNNDGVVNEQDIDVVIGWALDLNGNGSADATDVQIVINAALFYQRIRADIDHSGEVDPNDMVLVINAALGHSIGNYNADVNRDGNVNAVDVQQVVNVLTKSRQVITFKGTDYHYCSQRNGTSAWRENDPSVHTYWTDEWVVYTTNIPEAGDWDLNLLATNIGNKPPLGYSFKIQVDVREGDSWRYVGTFTIPLVVDPDTGNNVIMCGGIKIPGLKAGRDRIKLRWKACGNYRDYKKVNGIVVHDANLRIHKVVLSK